MRHESRLGKQLEEYAQGMVREWREQTARAGRTMDEIAAAVEWIPYGGSETGEPLEIVATLGPVELEYGAIRKGCGVIDAPHRATLRITGADRRDFLNRMLTQELKNLEAGGVRESFWLNRKGRIDADLLLIERGEEMLVDVDLHQASTAITTLNEFIFTEDIALSDASEDWYRLQLHGRRALDVLRVASGQADLEIEPKHHAELSVAGAGVIAARQDLTGEPGFALFVPSDSVAAVFDALLGQDETVGEGKKRIRPIGWYAFNIARIEAGTPIFNIDFGPENLPHESGLLHERVNFKKGCYLGQEIVARMESLGKPKQKLVGLRVEDDALPVAGSEVFQRDGESMGSVIGAITSSTLSPMLGAQPVAFAMIRTKYADAGEAVMVAAEGSQAIAHIQPLQFWSSAPTQQAGVSP